MNLRGTMAALFGVANVANKLYTDISPHETVAITATINQARKHPQITAANEELVTWDYQLQSALNTYTATIDPYWFFEQSYNPRTGTQQWNGFQLMQQPEFVQFSDYKYLLHDTCRDSTNDVEGIIRWRLNGQKHCFDYAKCNTTSFDHYRTCNTHPIVLQSSTPCSWFWQYIPPLLKSDLNSVACVLLGIPGPFTPGHQPNSFFCYGRFTTPVTDQPYAAGKECSKCPDYAPRCIEGLCAPALTM